MNAAQERQERKDEKALNLSAFIKGLWKYLIWLPAGFCAGACTLPFGAVPFGIALVAARGREAAFAYLGALVAALLEEDATRGLIYAGVLTALLLLRALYCLVVKRAAVGMKGMLASLFCESPRHRILWATGGAFALSLCFVTAGGFLYYDLFGMLLSVASAPLAAYLFYLVGKDNSLLSRIGFLILCAVASYGLSPLSIYGVSLCMAGGLMLCFAVTRKNGLLMGLLTAFAVGLAYSPLLLPVFGVAALAMWGAGKISHSLACTLTFVLGSGWCFYMQGLNSLSGAIGGVICGCLLYSAAARTSRSTLVRKVEEKHCGGCRVADESELDSIRLFELNRRMSAISEGLLRISELPEEISARRPDAEEIYAVCEGVLQATCGDCPRRTECEREGLICAAVGSLSGAVQGRGTACVQDAPYELRGGCGRLCEMLEEINYSCAALLSPLGFFTGEGVESDCREISRLLCKSMEGEEDEYTPDGPLSASLCAALNKADVGGCSVLAYGRRQKNVYIKAESADMLRSSRELVVSALNGCLPLPIDELSVRVREQGGTGIFTATCRNRLRVETVVRQVMAKQESGYCGDRALTFENSQGNFFALISDGMGSGRQAWAVSQMCAGALCGMLQNMSMNRELAAMLNSVLRLRSGGESSRECSATLDLLELELSGGRARLYKNGAAPSYVLHNGQLFKLRASGCPLGILPRVETKSTELLLSLGDVVVMMSDGVTGDGEESPWLYELLRRNAECSSLERISELIIKYAVGHGARDDISVVIAKVVENG